MHRYISYLLVICTLATPLICHATILVEENPAPPTEATPPSAFPVITEVLPNPASGKEWVELYNPTSSTLDLTGWKLCDNRATGCTIATLATTLEPGQWLVIYLSSSVLNNDGDSVLLKDISGIVRDEMRYSGALVPKKGQSLIKTETGWKITLTPTPEADNLLTEPTAAPATIAGAASPALPTTETTKTSAPKPPPTPPQYIIWKTDLPGVAVRNQATQLSAAKTVDKRGGSIFVSWQLPGSIYEGTTIEHRFTTSGPQTITMFAASTSGTTSTQQTIITVVEPTSTPILISEVAPDNDEFIELYNSSTTSLNLTGWVLALDNGDRFTLSPDTTIPGRGYRVFYAAATGLALINSTTTIFLLNSSTTLADTITYQKIISNTSYQRDGLDWEWREPSPGTPIPPPTPIILGEKIISTPKKASKKSVPIYQKISIAAAREEENGTTVQITGRVAVLPGIFNSQSWYLVDEAGGIAIFRADARFPALTIGQRVTVLGTHSSQNSIPRLKAEQLYVGATGNLQPVSTTLALTEEFPGQLVTVTGEITKRLTNQLYLHDVGEEITVVIKKGTNINTKNNAIGDQVQVTGIAEQTARGIELWPRDQNDIAVLTSTKPHAEVVTPEKKRNWLPAVVTVSALLVALAWFKNKKTPYIR